MKEQRRDGGRTRDNKESGRGELTMESAVVRGGTKGSFLPQTTVNLSHDKPE